MISQTELSYVTSFPLPLSQRSARDTRPARDETLVGMLFESLAPEGQERFDLTRQEEVCQGLVSLREEHPDLSDHQSLYLLGFWAGNRALRNANHFASNARRNLAEVERLAADLSGQEAGTCLSWGYQHGSEARAARGARKAARSA